MTYWTFLRKQLTWATIVFLAMVVITDGNVLSGRFAVGGLILVVGAALIAWWEFWEADRKANSVSR